MQQDDAVHAQTAPGSSMVLQIDKGVGKQFLLIIWLSSFISAAAFVALIATCFFIYKNIGYVAVLEYDLMDLRAKVGQAHENTPAPVSNDVAE